MKFFCKEIIVNKPERLLENGPLLIAANHPNSFLDAIILDILFKQPVYSLARGDVFVNKWIVRILTAFRILPVYRLSEGADNLQSNYATFDECKKIFRKKGLVLIFSEGKCINEWHLRTLKKGTARLAISSWDQNIPLKVLPAGLNYSSFRRFGKTIHINFGEMILQEKIDIDSTEGSKIQAFNQILRNELHQLVYEIAPTDLEKKQKLFNRSASSLLKILLFIPAMLGWLIHLPLYFPVRKITYKKTYHNDHYDSVMLSLLLVTYPIYLLISSFTIYWLSGSAYSFLIFLTAPFLAWTYIHYKSAV